MNDFSKPPLEMLLATLPKDYVGLNIEQGMPILARSLNLLNDLVMVTVRNTINRHSSNGVAANSQSFAIQAIASPVNAGPDAPALEETLLFLADVIRQRFEGIL